MFAAPAARQVALKADAVAQGRHVFFHGPNRQHQAFAVSGRETVGKNTDVTYDATMHIGLDGTENIAGIYATTITIQEITVTSGRRSATYLKGRFADQVDPRTLRYVSEAPPPPDPEAGEEYSEYTTPPILIVPHAPAPSTVIDLYNGGTILFLS